jgi:hypothetical protein
MTQPNEEPPGYAYQVDQPGQPYGYPVMPAPMMYRPAPRPGTATAAAVLAFVQAGITGVAALVLLFALVGSDATTGALLVEVLVVLATGAGAGLLIAGGVQLMAGRRRTLMIAGCVLQFVICVYYLIVFATLSDSDFGPEPTDPELQGMPGLARGMLIVLALFFAIMPTISLSLSLGRSTKAFLARG